MLTVSTPFDSHLIGLEVKRNFSKLKWVAFFSDMWPVKLLPAPHYRKKILSQLEFSLMQNVVQQCDGILTPSKYTLDILNKYFKTNAKLSTIPHCLNDKKFKKQEQLNGYLVHSGFLQKERVNESLVKAINELGIENKEFGGLIQIGAYHPKIKNIIKKYNCGNIILVGHIPEELASKIQSLFEIGVIIEAPMEYVSPFLPSKITDSILLNKKLVAITPPKSYLTDFAYQHKGIFCCSYEKDEIKRCILNALYSEEVISTDAVSIFNPANIAELYDGFFNSLE